MNSLFPSKKIVFDLPDAIIGYYPNLFDKTEADTIFNELLQTTLWQQDEITLFGKTHPQPRLTALYGNDGKPYSYSHITMQPHPWSLLLHKIKHKIKTVVDTNFTSVLLNLYRDGKDSNGWHADNEKELGENPVIASVSFGAERSFHLQHNLDKNCKQKIILEHGSLLIMEGTTQHFWKHQIAKTAKPIGPRINLTFRLIK
ncbi:alpha-ketoglutarate-dependent dioxygenase AlkB [Flavobacterium sp. GT3R68]|uniref:alpha-ketoglutarate-dependent dioxygenase AlkB family protein n=1 Tax=Flavobacterium sp. GT3R68 TaxID=2594437 RepID=UPI000F873A33|nr:alpha-ketoglutarate-dependent dioxygenase AlkB [Flavobacterium sp. GT3R68]RTY93367.1 alpha-ketoglutarate-dependent dioxygenase AlkB [Flavobacterium sp. GSN2]TRW92459.1 alpha-ketoglutarate-dependent dioxygenase AlkB [Flavobacterium sp. GT3R68]